MSDDDPNGRGRRPSDDPDARELAEAAALAEALEGKPADAEVSEDAEVAALLRYAAGDAELGEEPGEAILQGLVADGLPPARAPEPRRRGLPAWVVGLGAALTAVAAMLYLQQQPLQDSAQLPAPPPPSGGFAPQQRASDATLPAPPARLLSAQAAASQTAGGRAALDAEMGRYRERVLRALENRYPTQLGMRVSTEDPRP